MQRRSPPPEMTDAAAASLVELLDYLLEQGVVLDGEIVIGLANVDLVSLRLGLLLCAVDRALTSSERS